MAKIKAKHLAKAVRKAANLSIQQQEAVVDEIHSGQPHLLSSILLQKQLGNSLEQVDVLLQILIVTWLAIKLSGRRLHLVSDDELDKHQQRYIGHVNFMDGLPPIESSRALQGYVDDHPENLLLAYVHDEIMTAGFHLIPEEHAKYLTLTAINLVNCVAANLSKKKTR